ncbi:F0F1 ATP synthase subunit A [Anaerotalea alkaliphila]|uniref:ATP synthase subunit a n=1 Tax=Anaerotalea alkaliphila TaxID=2662126 RepID=A0A7X5HU51_9FIRM|nr:F0F1 ATP synthase subunit A [Anaerotalea alkaliphila]NDL66711.1 F0F1 ATP synthase subunit A [Anaerotalea alkaliphila]
MDFSIHVAKVLQIGGLEIWITESMVNSWIIAGILILLALFVRSKMRDPEKVPTGIQNVVELLVDTLDNFSESTMGKHGRKFSSFYAGLFIYILLSNLSGLFLGPNWNPEFPLPVNFMRPPTADVAVTFALALITFFMTQGFGIKSKGVFKWMKDMTEPMVLLTPLNIIGELANPVSLSFRLFGNILGGTIIMGLYYNLPWPALVGIPVVLHGYFDIFAGVLQSFIFVMLSMTFVSSAMD